MEKALRISLHGRWPHDSGLYIYTRNDTAGGNAKAPSVSPHGHLNFL